MGAKKITVLLSFLFVTIVYSLSFTIPTDSIPFKSKQQDGLTITYETFYPTIKNLKASINNEKVTLSWTGPDKEIPIGNPNDESNGSIRMNKMIYAVRWSKDDLTSWNGYALKQIKFLSGPILTSVTYSARVWEGGSEASAGTLIAQKEVTDPVTSLKWITVTLDTPVPIDINKDLCIGIYTESTEGNYPVSIGKNPGIREKTNLYSSGDDLWNTYKTVNWCISGIIEPIAGAPSGYTIYRNGDVIGNISGNNYTDVVSFGEYTYGISANYNDNESDKVETKIRITYLGIDPVQQVKTPAVFPNPVKKGESLTINLGEFGNEAELSYYNTSGQLILQEQVSNRISSHNIQLDPGVYLLYIKKEKQIHTLRLVIK